MNAISPVDRPRFLGLDWTRDGPLRDERYVAHAPGIGCLGLRRADGRQRYDCLLNGRVVVCHGDSLEEAQSKAERWYRTIWSAVDEHARGSPPALPPDAAAALAEAPLLRAENERLRTECARLRAGAAALHAAVAAASPWETAFG